MSEGLRLNRCEKCRFWEETEDFRDLGQCRRHAPQIASSMLRVLQDSEDGRFASDLDVFGATLWPVTEAVDWCGEWSETTTALCQRIIDDVFGTKESTDGQ